MFNWLRRGRREAAASARPAPLGPIARYESSGRCLADAPPATQELLRLAEDAHRRRHSDPGRDAPPKPGLPVTGPDDEVLAMLGGARFGPSASVTPPSGAILDSTEVQTWTDLYDPERGR